MELGTFYLRITIIAGLLYFIYAVPTSIRRQKGISRLNKKVPTRYRWSAWSEFTPCSRSCGLGVKSRVRNCYRSGKRSTRVPASECCGFSRQYRTCNRHPCHVGSSDFRYLQCSFFNGQHNWTSLGHDRQKVLNTSFPEPCALYCASNDTSAPVVMKFSEQVVDGTSCNDGRPKVCVAGKCVSVGCDGRLGSRRELDNCGVCGGNDKDCNVVSGRIRRRVDKGYSALLVLKPGSRHIRITEKPRSRVVLAIKDKEGIFFMHQTTKDKASTREVAGSIFKYKQISQSGNITEVLETDGPINETVTIMGFTRSDNAAVAIWYSYTKLYLKSFQKQTSTLNYSIEPFYPWESLLHSNIADSNGDSDTDSTTRPSKPRKILNKTEIETEKTKDQSNKPEFSILTSTVKPYAEQTTTAYFPSKQSQKQSYEKQRNSRRKTSKQSSKKKSTSVESIYPQQSTKGTSKLKHDLGQLLSNAQQSPNIGQPPKKSLRQHEQNSKASSERGNRNYSSEQEQSLKPRIVLELAGPRKVSPDLNKQSMFSATRNIEQFSLIQKQSKERKLFTDNQDKSTDSRTPSTPNSDLESLLRMDELIRTNKKVKKKAKVKRKRPQKKKKKASTSSRHVDNKRQLRLKHTTSVPPANLSIFGGFRSTTPSDISSIPTIIYHSSPEYLTSANVTDFPPERKKGRSTQRAELMIKVDTKTNEPDNLNGYRRRRLSLSLKKKFEWRENNISPCSSTCEIGVSVTFYKCYSYSTNQPVDDLYCDQDEKPPVAHHTCSRNSCPPRWVAGEWGECSRTCGEGVQERQVKCWQLLAPGFDSSVHDYLCPNTSKPRQTQTCNAMLLCGPVWEMSEWEKCSVDCGYGVQIRHVRCSDGNDRSCDGPRPEDRKPCIQSPCSNHWYAATWSECNGICGVKHRQVFCRDSRGHVLDDGMCSAKTRPLTVHACGRCQHVWVPQTWGKCSTVCGKGFVTRQIVCGSVQNSEFYVEKDSYCQSTPRPVLTTRCAANPCPPRWYTTQWGQCSKTCGDGAIRMRDVRCYHNDQRSEECLIETQPFNVEPCQVKECPEER